MFAVITLRVDIPSIPMPTIKTQFTCSIGTITNFFIAEQYKAWVRVSRVRVSKVRVSRVWVNIVRVNMVSRVRRIRITRFSRISRVRECKVRVSRVGVG